MRHVSPLKASTPFPRPCSQTKLVLDTGRGFPGCLADVEHELEPSTPCLTRPCPHISSPQPRGCTGGAPRVQLNQAGLLSLRQTSPTLRGDCLRLQHPTRRNLTSRDRRSQQSLLQEIPSARTVLPTWELVSAGQTFQFSLTQAFLSFPRT